MASFLLLKFLLLPFRSHNNLNYCQITQIELLKLLEICTNYQLKTSAIWKWFVECFIRKKIHNFNIFSCLNWQFGKYLRPSKVNVFIFWSNFNSSLTSNFYSWLRWAFVSNCIPLFPILLPPNLYYRNLRRVISISAIYFWLIIIFLFMLCSFNLYLSKFYKAIEFISWAITCWPIFWLHCH